MSGSMSTAGGSIVLGSAEGPHGRWVPQVEEALPEVFVHGQAIEVMVGTFANRVSLSGSWRTTPGGALRDLLGAVQLGGRSPAIDAISVALDRLDGPASIRRAIALITDGFNAGNRLRAPAVVARAVQLRVPVSTIIRSHGIDGGAADRRARQWFAEIAAATGGRHVDCETRRRDTACSPGKNLKGALRLIAEDLVRPDERIPPSSYSVKN